VRQAPPIALTLSGSGAWRVAHVALPALSAAVAVFWLSLWLALPFALHLAALTSVLIAAMVWSGSRPRPVHLRWNGEYWAADGRAGEVDVMLDLGPWMLLRFRPPDDVPRWLPVPRREAGPAEQGLRAALYARGAAAAARRQA
jgi:hypothetical protein